MLDASADVAMAPGARGKLRKIQVSQETFHSVVASQPSTVEEVRADKATLAEVQEWEGLTIDWLKRHYGPALKSVIRNTDEIQWHIHAYVLKSHDLEFRAAVFHPGIFAKRAVMAGGAEARRRREGAEQKVHGGDARLAGFLP